MEPEKKDLERKVAHEPSVKGRAPLVKVEEVTVEEGTSAEPTDTGKSGSPSVLSAYPACSLFYLNFLSLLNI